MKIGDLVRIAYNGVYAYTTKIGIIVAVGDYIDVLWSDSGLVGWYEEDQLEVINESR